MQLEREREIECNECLTDTSAQKIDRQSDIRQMVIKEKENGQWGGGGSAELFACPYPLNVQARPPQDQ